MEVYVNVDSTQGKAGILKFLSKIEELSASNKKASEVAHTVHPFQALLSSFQSHLIKDL